MIRGPYVDSWGDDHFLTLEQGRAAVHAAKHQFNRTLPWGVYEDPDHPLHRQPVSRRETGLLEVHCHHGVGHPIPASVEWLDAFGPEGAKGSWGTHGCDGCCG